jgi:hypothetical protein
MAVYFKDLDNSRDWRTLVEELALTASAGITGNLPAIYKGVRDAITKSTPNPSIDERAGVWRRVTATAALLALLNDARFGGPLDKDRQRRHAAKDFLAEVLSLTGFDHFDPALMPDMAGLPALGRVTAKLPKFVRTLTPDLAASDAEIASRYVALLRSTSARVHALDTEFYAPLVAALGSPFATGYARDLAWARRARVARMASSAASRKRTDREMWFGST